MPATNVAGAVVKLNKTATNLSYVPERGVKAALRVAKVTMVKAGDAVNTPHQLRGKKKGNAWGVRYMLTPKVASATGLIYYFGAPPYWRERGIEGHEITPKKGHEVMLANGFYFPTASHPGVAARPFWQPTKQEVNRETKAIVAKATTTAITQGLRA